jgi:hypothetical protein
VVEGQKLSTTPRLSKTDLSETASKAQITHSKDFIHSDCPRAEGGRQHLEEDVPEIRGCGSSRSAQGFGPAPGL